MRIGIDAHILSPEHHRHHPDIALYTQKLLEALLELDTENTYVLFMDARMPAEELAKFKRPNTEIKHFPFTQYRSYLPFVYSHMLVSSLLAGARLDVFHSPEGLIPYLYPGKIVATFHWVPTGKRDANIFVKTWMLGARTGFRAFAAKADSIILRNSRDHDILCEIHSYPTERAQVILCQDLNTVDWKQHARDVHTVYMDVIARPKRGLLSPSRILDLRKKLPSLPSLRRSKKSKA